MRTRTLAWYSSVVIAAALGLGTIGGTAGAPQAPTEGTSDAGYVWADACRKCHEDIYASWSKTKHAKALGRLSAEEQQKECVGCHVTGPKQKLEKNGKVVNGGIQCESCHGASAAHAADPTTHTAFGAKPPEKVCTSCHSDKSPHFKGFFYQGMASFSHPVKK